MTARCCKQLLFFVRGVSREDYLTNLLKAKPGSSSETFAGLLQVMAQHKPPYVSFENVPELAEGAGGSNMNYFIEAARALGYELAYRVLCATDYFMPQKRNRVFGICGEVESSGLLPKETQLLLEGMMQLVESMMCKPEEVLPLETFLLPGGDPYLQAEMDRQTAVREKSVEKPDMQFGWRNTLLDMCRKKGFNMNTLALPKHLESAQGILSLCRREARGLAYYLTVNPDLRALDVQPTIGRMTPCQHDALHTFLPSSRVVLIKEARLLLGFEALRIQGFSKTILTSYVHHASKQKSHIEIDPFFMDLAGNA